MELLWNVIGLTLTLPLTRVWSFAPFVILPVTLHNNTDFFFFFFKKGKKFHSRLLKHI